MNRLQKNTVFYRRKIISTTKEYKDYIIEQLGLLSNIICRKMMGEYLLYNDGVLFGGIYDNCLLFKRTNSNKKYNMSEENPYQGAKPMYLAENVDNRELLRDIVTDTCKDLPIKK